jgi:hypothetical protein
MEKYYYSPSKIGFYIDSINIEIPEDKVEITKQHHIDLINGQASGKLIQADETGYPRLVDRPAPTTQQLIEQYTRSIQKRLDNFAKTKGYDSLLSACSYATSSVLAFSSEGQYCVNARDATWNKCYEILEQVNTNIIPLPSLEEIISQLPMLTWPQ